MQARLHQYLNAMGVQVWQLRETVPGAKPVVEVERDVYSEADQLTDQPSQIEPVLNDGHGYSNEISVAPAAEIFADKIEPIVTENPQAKITLASEQPLPVTADAVGEESNPEFRLASVIFPGCCMVVAQVPTQGADPLTPQHFTFLKNVLSTVGCNLLDDPVVTFFNWPMLRSPGFDQGESAARLASKAFLSGQKSKHNVLFTLLMGEDTGRYLLPNFDSFSQSQGRLISESDQPLLLSHSMGDLFGEPALKAAFWRDIQPLRLCLSQD